MTSLFVKESTCGKCYILTIEKANYDELMLLKHATDVINKNMKEGNINLFPDFDDAKDREIESPERLLKHCREIAETYKVNQGIANTMKQEILRRLANKEDPSDILVYAAEAITRLGGNREDFTGAVTEALKKDGYTG